MNKDLVVGDIIGIYEVVSLDRPVKKDGHKQILVRCTCCGLEKDIRPINLGATLCNHKQIISPRYCLSCNSIIPYDADTNPTRYKLRKFCCSSCAAKVNNKREHSEASKIKASKTALKRFYEEAELLHVKDLTRAARRAHTKSAKRNSKYYDESLVFRKDYVTCPYCDQRFSQLQSSHLKVHNKTFSDLYTEFGADYTVISETSAARKSAASKAVQQKLIDAGIHIGWQSRNKKSYAEKFWITVLENNSIDYTCEVPVWHGSANYFLDFVIERNNKLIDLEIDGKQHKYADRLASDVARDSFLAEQGYLVYRIPWNDLNTEAGKEEMRKKIDNFLAFYNSI